jgi:SAM-dependent methyltransferase
VIVLNRTRAKLVFECKKLVFSGANLQPMLDEQRARTLEDHMGFRGQWQEHRRFQFDFLKSVGLKPESTLLEIGCGPLTLAIPAIDYLERGHYTGIDVRPEVLNLAHSEIALRNLSSKNPRLLYSESFGSELTETFDFVWSFSVLYHLTDDLLNQCLAQVARRGVYYANVNTVDAESRWLQFPFVCRSLDFYRDQAAKHGLTVTVIGQLQDLGFRLAGQEKTNHLLRFNKASQ